jgi:hypothetical protein
MEAHIGKIRGSDSRFTLPIVYFRIAARGIPAALRAPALERLLARADPTGGPWRTEAFRAIAADGEDPPPIAVAQWRASGHTLEPGWVALATPVHLVAGMSSVCLPTDGILELDASEADTLAAGFNRAFGGQGARLARGLGSGLLCAFDERLAVHTTPPDEALGGDIWPHQPRGEGSAALRRLAAEIEMWLFDHAVNAARRARGVPVISALWLWVGRPVRMRCSRRSIAARTGQPGRASPGWWCLPHGPGRKPGRTLSGIGCVPRSASSRRDT